LIGGSGLRPAVLNAVRVKQPRIAAFPHKTPIAAPLRARGSASLVGEIRREENAMRTRSIWLKAALLVAGVTALGGATCPGTQGGGIHGYVVAALAPHEAGPFPAKQDHIALPDVTITATDVSTGAVAAMTTSNAHGYFRLPHFPPGNYQVCAQAAGFDPLCYPGTVAIAGATVILDQDMRLVPKPGVVAGRVVLGGPGTPACFTDRPAFDTLVQARVTVRDGNGNVLAGPVNGNGAGEFMLADVRLTGRQRLVADCAGSSAEVPVVLGAPQMLVSLSMPNAAPTIQRVELTVAGRPARLVPPSGTAKLRVVAQDPDGNPLTFRWTDASGVALPGSSDTTTYTVPATASSTTVFVQASDGRGGFAHSLVPVTGSAPRDALFAGRVVDADTGAPLGGVRVSVNGTGVISDPAGAFTATVPETVRYAITANMTGYALVSKVTYAPAAELRLPLQKVTGVPFNVAEGGLIVSPPTNKRNLRATLRIPPGSLVVDATGAPAAGTGTAYVWGYPAGTPMPGDMSALAGGAPSRLETFGAVDIQLVDASGQKLQVAGTAQLGLTLQATNPAGPASMPLYLFEEGRGMWIPHGTLAKVGADYSGAIKHLTAFNADVAFGTTGCMEYRVDSENSPGLPFYLHIEQNGETVNHEPFQVSDVAGVVSRLRPNTSTTWWALPTPTSPLADAIGTGSFMTGSFTSDPANPNGDFPEVGAVDASGAPRCNVITLTARFPGHLTYLQGLFGPPPAGERDDYVVGVDGWAAGGARNDFTAFKNLNGFPAGEASAVYYNKADLRLGRDMHCRQTSDNRVACYVSNYSDILAAPAGAASSLHAAAKAHATLGTDFLFATVAMEWDPNKTDDTKVQFYVYNAAGVRQTQAVLDTEGPKDVPRICIACHGGRYDPATKLVRAARFLPFDVASFATADDLFSADALATPLLGVNLAPFTRQNQLAQFRALNALVRLTETASGSTAVTELIDGWYQGCGGVGSAGCNACVGGAGCPRSFNSSFRPALFDVNDDVRALYDNVVRPYCRGCHINLPGREWNDPAQMTSMFRRDRIDSFVCRDNPRKMAHAEVPFKAFWQSPVAPLQLTRAPMNLPACTR
jgi:hypothetical protein